MTKSTVVPFELPSELSPDPLTKVIQAGARELLRTAVQAEVAAFIAEHATLLDDAGRQRLVRHGFLPEREIMTGIGTVPVQVPRVRDRGANEDGSKIRFRSSLVPPYLRKAKSVEELLPWLYLKGISTGDFSEALAALLGPDAEGLSASTITRLKATWWGEYETWRKRDLSGKRYVYIWADGVYFTPRGWTVIVNVCWLLSARTSMERRTFWRSWTGFGRTRTAGGTCFGGCKSAA